MRTKDLKASAEANCARSSTLRVAPNFAAPTTLNADPILMNDLMLNALPSESKSRTLNKPAQRALAAIASALPMRAQDRRLSALPI
jgi:hypothetical protein